MGCSSSDREELLCGTGMYLLFIIQRENFIGDINLLDCNRFYPNLIESVEIKAILKLKKLFQVMLG